MLNIYKQIKQSSVNVVRFMLIILNKLSHNNTIHTYRFIELWQPKAGLHNRTHTLHIK